MVGVGILPHEDRVLLFEAVDETVGDGDDGREKINELVHGLVAVLVRIVLEIVLRLMR